MYLHLVQFTYIDFELEPELERAQNIHDHIYHTYHTSQSHQNHSTHSTILARTAAQFQANCARRSTLCALMCGALPLPIPSYLHMSTNLSVLHWPPPQERA